MVNVFAVLNPLLSGLMKLSGLRSRTVEIEPGTTMHFWVPNKTSNKPAVVLLHGFAGNGMVTWIIQAVALAGKYQVYVPDLLFFGGSTTSSADRSPDFQADCVAMGLKKLGVERCTAVGFSYGGMVGFRMAERNRELVQCLVVSGAVAALTESFSRQVLERLGCKSWAEFLLPTTVDGLKALFAAGTHRMIPFSDWMYRDYMEVMFDNRREKAELLRDDLVISDDNYTMLQPDRSQSLHFLVGENDKIFNLESIHDTKKKLGDKATVWVVKKAGHLAHLERPCVYNRFLKTILATVRADGSKRHTN